MVRAPSPQKDICIVPANFGQRVCCKGGLPSTPGVRVRVSACVYELVHVCVSACVSVCMRVSVCARLCVHGRACA